MSELKVAAAAASLSMADADITGGDENEGKKKLPLMATVTFTLAPACGTLNMRWRDPRAFLAPHTQLIHPTTAA